MRRQPGIFLFSADAAISLAEGTSYRSAKRRRQTPDLCELAKPHVSSICRYTCSRAIELHQHKRLRHNRSVPYTAPPTCVACKQHFRFPCELQHHMLVRHNVGTWLKCSVCKSLHATNSRLVRHEKSHQTAADTSKAFVCSYCGRAFVRKANAEKQWSD